MARFAVQQIARARRHFDGAAFPALAPFAPEAQTAGCAERQRHHLSKIGLVAVPTDAGARRIFRHQCMGKLFCFDTAEPGRDLAQWRQEFRRRFCFPELRAAIIVAPAERDHTSVAEIAMKLEGLERQVLKAAHKSIFFGGREKAVLIAEALDFRFAGKKLRLPHAFALISAAITLEGRTSA